MKNYPKLAVLTLILFFVSCGEPENTSETENSTNEVVTPTEEVTTEPEIDVDALVKEIDDKRASIEASIETYTEMSTADMREKIKQKWEKIHFYTQGDKVIRIKTYPYKSISTRTEEFYLDDEQQLLLAVIEDNGAGDKGKSKDDLDKMYYYHNDKMIFEQRGTEEDEYSVKDSDAEELLEEVMEYLANFVKNQ